MCRKCDTMFWRMEVIKGNGKGVWMREIEKVLKRFDTSLKWLLERIGLRDEEIDAIGRSGEIEEREKRLLIRAKRVKCIDEVFGEVEVLIDTHFFNEFS